METIIKQTREVGTSAGVLLPKSWLNKEVVVTLLKPSKDKIAEDVLKIIIKKNLKEDIKGVYLFGSHARGDADSNSDVDILAITGKTNKTIKVNSYEITFVSEKNFAKNLPNNLLYQSFLKELYIILNEELIKKYQNKEIKFNVKRNLLEISRVLNINKSAVRLCNQKGKKIPDGIVYSLILRLKEMLLIKCILSKKPYSSSELLRHVSKEIYQAYLRIKRNKKEQNNVNPEDIIPIIQLSEKWLKDLRGLKKESKV
jgi:predicted nucleotidyltransferase